MDLLNKVKNFFYEEVEVDEAEEARKEEEKRRLKEQKREEKRRASLEKIEKMKAERALKEEKKRLEQTVEVERPVVQKEEDLTERELFKSERTFNFPMDLGDDIFDAEETKEEAVPEKPKVEERRTTTYVRPTTVSRYDNISRQPAKEEVKEEPHKFRPSPVISPVYGILDKNYTVDDVKEKNLDSTKEFSIEKKIVDFDSVRNRAYKDLDEEIEKTLTESKDIFYNLDSEPEVKDVISEYEEEPHDAEENDVVITYEDEEPEETKPFVEPEVEIKVEGQEEDDDDEMPTPDIEIPKKTKRTRRSKKTEVKEEKEDTKEDLFNLIDNMYNDDDEEEDD